MRLCHACGAAYARKILCSTCAAKAPHRRRLASAEERAKEREAHKEYDRKNKLAFKYGLSQGDVEKRWIEQKGLCAICTKALHRRDQNGCHIDHDHLTGRFRGLLCGGCNRGLGAFGDNAEGVAKALAYLKDERHDLG